MTQDTLHTRTRTATPEHTQRSTRLRPAAWHLHTFCVCYAGHCTPCRRGGCRLSPLRDSTVHQLFATLARGLTCQYRTATAAAAAPPPRHRNVTMASPDGTEMATKPRGLDTTDARNTAAIDIADDFDDASGASEEDEVDAGDGYVEPAAAASGGGGASAGAAASGAGAGASAGVGAGASASAGAGASASAGAAAAASGDGDGGGAAGKQAHYARLWHERLAIELGVEGAGVHERYKALSKSKREEACIRAARHVWGVKSTDWGAYHALFGTAITLYAVETRKHQPAGDGAAGAGAPRQRQVRDGVGIVRGPSDASLFDAKVRCSQPA